MNTLHHYMSWEGGIDLCALTDPALAMPNLIVHLARTVHTPVGSAPSGMVLLQLDPQAPPSLMGFVSSDPNVGAYFGPHIFKDTPFETAPVLSADFDFQFEPQRCSVQLNVAGHQLLLRFAKLGPLELIQRSPQAMPPFFQQGLESQAGEVELSLDGRPLQLTLPAVGISGGPPAVWSPAGIYAR